MTCNCRLPRRKASPRPRDPIRPGRFSRSAPRSCASAGADLRAARARRHMASTRFRAAWSKSARRCAKRVRREILEETGLTIEPVALAGYRERIARDANGRVEQHFVILQFAARWGRGRASPKRGTRGSPLARPVRTCRTDHDRGTGRDCGGRTRDCCAGSMIPKSGHRFLEKIMLQQTRCPCCSPLAPACVMAHSHAYDEAFLAALVSLGLLGPINSVRAQTTATLDDSLQRLSEILGALHYLRSVCAAAEGNKWRSEMAGAARCRSLNV